MAVMWTIAGSDCSAGAGIQADMNTARSFSVKAYSVITAVTAQNHLGLTALNIVSPQALQSQISALMAMPALPDVIKLGMLASCEHAHIVHQTILAIRRRKPAVLVVADPVFGASLGGDLSDDKAALIEFYRSTLLNTVDIVCPNINEAQLLSGLSISDESSLKHCAETIQLLGLEPDCDNHKPLKHSTLSVLITGGHGNIVPNYCADYFLAAEPFNTLKDDRLAFYLISPRIDTQASHGSGCTLSSAIAANLAQGRDIEDALVLAKMYLNQGLRANEGEQQYLAVQHLGFPRDYNDLPVFSRDLQVFKQTLAAPDFASCPSSLGLYPVVDSVEWLERLLALGIKTIQLRLKNNSEEQLRSKIAVAVKLQQHYDARLFINDYWALAIEYGAYGVHLGQEDLDDDEINQQKIESIARSGLRLGVSNHSYFELARSKAINPSYLAMGPIFPTKTKVMRWQQQGIELLQAWVDLLSPHSPLVAIGGINEARMAQVCQTGVGSVAMVSEITEAEDVEAKVAALMAYFEVEVEVETEAEA